MGPLLKKGELERYHAIGVEGSPVYLSAPQLLSLVRQRLGDTIADAFAVPQRSESGDAVYWYASATTGTVVPWSAASADERAEAEEAVLQVQGGILRLAGEMTASEATDQRRFGRYLVEMARFPSKQEVFLVDGKPTITFWGFEASRAEHPRGGLGPVGAPEPSLPNAQIDRGAGRRWPWLILLLVLLLAAGLLLLRQCDWPRLFPQGPDDPPRPADPAPEARLDPPTFEPAFTLPRPSENSATSPPAWPYPETGDHHDADTGGRSPELQPPAPETDARTDIRSSTVITQDSRTAPGSALTVLQGDTHIEVDAPRYRVPLVVTPGPGGATTVSELVEENRTAALDVEGAQALGTLGPESVPLPVAIDDRGGRDSEGLGVDPTPASQEAQMDADAGALADHDAVEGGEPPSPDTPGLPAPSARDALKRRATNAEVAPDASNALLGSEDASATEPPAPPQSPDPEPPREQPAVEQAAPPPRPDPGADPVSERMRDAPGAPVTDADPMSAPNQPMPAAGVPGLAPSSGDADGSALATRPESQDQAHPMPLTLASEANDVAALDGRWTADLALKDSSGQAVRMSIGLDNGSARLSLHRPGHAVCEAPADATLAHGELQIVPTQDLVCSDRNFGRPTLTCNPGAANAEADCYGAYPSGKRFKVRLSR